ncbi:PREDICTED: KIF1-binding protein homolog [Priapulus caudatus]|uniref:KIF-binding protein n=1 Tax=Priapulus caudatus TaxID=37621 RepID=A0ABM1ERD4_PRICU|nr:PREDICTED: KIF1-binding protein homolog [Priapulus caudatus]
MSRSCMDMATSTQWSPVGFHGARITEAALMPSLRSAQNIPFYSLYNQALDYTELACDSSLLYKLLKFFESDFERKLKMHKRRVNALQGVLGELNPRHYLLVCRQLTYEIAEAYGETLDIKMAIVKEQQTTPSPHAISKINLLCAECIHNFELFLDSLRRRTARCWNSLTTIIFVRC